MIDSIKSYCSAKTPDILTGAGIVGLGFTIGLSVHAGQKVYKAKKQYERDMADITEAERIRDSGEIDPDTPYPPEDAEADRRDAKKTYVESVAKALALPVGVGAATAGCFVGAVGNANAKTAVAVATAESLAVSVNKLSDFIKKYRGRVVAEEGELKDLHYALGGEIKDVTEEEVDEKTGKSKKVKKKVLDGTDADLEDLSPYQLIWGPYKRNGQPNHNFIGNRNLDMTFLSAIEGNCESILQRKGYLKLTDVFHELNEDDMSGVLSLGWIRKFRDEAVNQKLGLTRDGHVNFRIKPLHKGDITMFLLDFNCDGYIEDKIDLAVKQNAEEIGVKFKR